MSPLGIEIRHLEMLDALLTEAHVSRAAEKLALTQPAVSNGLARLRLHFQDELLVRQGGRMRLTPFAERLQEQLAEILQRVRALALARPGFRPAESDRTFRLALPPHLGALILPALLEGMAETAPAAHVECVPLVAASAGFERGEIDALICRTELLPPGCPHIPLLEDSWRCIIATGAVAGSLSRADMMAQRFVLPQGEHQRTMPALEMDLKWAATVPVDMIPHIVADTQLAAIVPASFALFYERSLPLTSYSLPLRTPAIRCALAWPRQHQHDPAGAWFRGQIAAAAQPADAMLSQRSNPSPEQSAALLAGPNDGLW